MRLSVCTVCARWWMFDAWIQTCSNTVRWCCLLEIHYLAVKCFKSSENNSESLECSPGWRLLLSTPLTPAGLGLHSLSLICWSSALRPLLECVCVCVCAWGVQSLNLREGERGRRGLLNIKCGPKKKKTENDLLKFNKENEVKRWFSFTAEFSMKAYRMKMHFMTCSLTNYSLAIKYLLLTWRPETVQRFLHWSLFHIRVRVSCSDQVCGISLVIPGASWCLLEYFCWSWR